MTYIRIAPRPPVRSAHRTRAPVGLAALNA